MAYKGKYKVQNPGKYAGNPANVEFRSLWERQAFRWLDENNSAIKRWSSEEIIVPYRCKTDGKFHRYFVDLYIEFANGKKLLVEIKPKKEMSPPKVPKRKTKRFVNQVMAYVKNTSKWEAATMFAESRKWKFEVWNEFDLKALGIVLLT
jgi:hypothetical protein